MKFPIALLTLFLTLAIANASNPHDHSLGARHSRISARMPSLEKKSPQKRCVRRNKVNEAPSIVFVLIVTAIYRARKPLPPQRSMTLLQPKLALARRHMLPNRLPAIPARTITITPEVVAVGVEFSLLQASAVAAMQSVSLSFNCPLLNMLNRPPVSTTKTSGPNGSIDFLNCGIDSGGWTPPSIHIKDVVVKSLSEAIQSSDSPFHACKPYVGFFNRYGDQYGVPPIFLASFAMQESSCNPNTVGGAGEQGLMQITKDKCHGAPGGNCRDPVSGLFYSYILVLMVLGHARILISALVPNTLRIP